MSQFGIDITFQFDPDASTIPCCSLLSFRAFRAFSPPFCANDEPPVRHFLLPVRDAN